MTTPEETTDFGFTSIPLSEKTHKVRDVFQSVAPYYDRMNDIMSFGLHRLWKRMAISLAQPRPGDTVLDLAGGSGDLSYLLSRAVGSQGQVILSDINASMLETGRHRLTDKGLLDNIEYVQANAEQLPFPGDSVHLVTIGFGLRNVTQKSKALSEMYRVCKPGGQMLVLEFSKPVCAGLTPVYDWYSFKVMPYLGKIFSQDEASYRYLAESIRMHPDQAALKTLIETAGFDDCSVHNLCGGIVAIHRAFKY
ncbi:MAG: bifunctional demethylmenaquinone methyltransferase/2-methoxy-6-polyprenyl-1,4-benzoquinol methylase UbiE [Legionellaceae bacterium]|nr:bifunctional demethylmenaquinone methyltransferase/2-methoxy-6-polyprenyl-1,4-benzoquinol methylase UbiE [Legionellaceae bacterium]